MIAMKPAPPSGTYFNVSKKRVALQLPDPKKDYAPKPILEAAENADLDGIRVAWEADEAAIGHSNARGHNVFHILARFGQAEGKTLSSLQKLLCTPFLSIDGTQSCLEG